MNKEDYFILLVNSLLRNTLINLTHLL